MFNVFQPATVYSLAHLAETAPGAVVSRTLVKTTGGTITSFAFAEGQGLSPHSAPFDALAQCVEGRGRITIDETDHDLGPGDVILMPADHPHAVQAVTDFKMLLVMLKGAR